jgi:ABC-type glycerol-3-phosphate transport system permease component
MSSSKAKRKRLSRRRAISYALRYAFIGLALIIFLFPIYWIASMAFRTGDEIFHSPPVYFPSTFSFEPVRRSDTKQSILALFNSIIVTTGATLLALCWACRGL